MRAFLVATAAGLLAVLLVGTGFARAGEVQPSVTIELTSTPIVEPTLDPCDEETPVGEAGEEVDLCPTETSTPTVPAPEPTATMTPTLEYEIDVPVSFFPSETAIAGAEETVAAATEVGGDEVADITGLPNAGGAGPQSGGGSDWMIMVAIVLGVASLSLVARANRGSQT